MPDALLLRGARVVDPATGHDADADVLVAGDRIEAVGTGLDARGRRGARLRGPGRSLPGSSTCTRTCASPASSTRRRSRPARGPRRPAASRRSRRWPTPTRSPTTRASWRRSATRRRRPGLADVFPVGAITKGARRRVDGRARRDGRGGGARLQRRRQLRADGPHAAQRARVREGVPSRGRDRRPLRGRLARRGRAHARGSALVLARPRRPSGRGGGDRRRARPRDRAGDRRAHPHLPRLERPVGRARPAREGATASG